MPVNQNQTNIYKMRNSFSFHTYSETFKFERYYLKIKKSIDPKGNYSYHNSYSNNVIKSQIFKKRKSIQIPLISLKMLGTLESFSPSLAHNEYYF